jgi:hypothetical protein
VIGSVIDPAFEDQKAVGVSRRLFALMGGGIASAARADAERA